MVTIQRQAYPAVRTTKEYDNVLFSFLRRHYSHQSKQKHSSVIFFFYSSLGAGCLSTPQIASEKETQEGNVKCPSSTREDTNLQRPTHVHALSDE